MSEEKQFDEKDEKELKKHDEKTEENDLLSSLAWAFILIWAGLVFLASNLGWFERLGLMVDSTLGFQVVRGLGQLRRLEPGGDGRRCDLPDRSTRAAFAAGFPQACRWHVHRVAGFPEPGIRRMGELELHLAFPPHRRGRQRAGFGPWTKAITVVGITGAAIQFAALVL